jgi:hypothetical protein
MTNIELLRDFRIAPDGIRVEIWRRGTTRHVDDATLAILISEGACAIVETQVYSPVQETKARPARKGKRK